MFAKPRAMVRVLLAGHVEPVRNPDARAWLAQIRDDCRTSAEDLHALVKAWRDRGTSLRIGGSVTVMFGVMMLLEVGVSSAQLAELVVQAAEAE